MRSTFIRSTFLLAMSLGVTLLSFNVAFANNLVYEPMVGIPGFQNQSDRTLSQYVNLIYMTLVALGALLALVKISIAGAKYMMSDAFNTKSEAKSDIKGALLGLAILVIPYIVLNTIYGGLTKTSVLDNNNVNNTVKADLRTN